MRRTAARAGQQAIAVLLALVAASSALRSRPATAGEGFGAHVEVTVALYQVRVLDESNCIAERVAPGDVLVFAGGRALPTTLRRSRGPLRVVFVVDASFSMEGRRLRLAERVAERLLERLAAERPGNLAGVAVFDEEVYWLTPEGFSADLCTAAQRVIRPVAGGGTALWRGLDAALDVAAGTPSRSATVIVTLSDGQDNSDRSGAVAERVRLRAVAMGVPIFAVAMPPRQSFAAAGEAWNGDLDVRCSRSEWVPRRLDRERTRLLRACTESGGAMYAPRRAEDVAEVADFLFAQIRDLHWVEAEVPPELAAANARLEVAATRHGFSVLASAAR